MTAFNPPDEAQRLRAETARRAVAGSQSFQINARRISTMTIGIKKDMHTMSMFAGDEYIVNLDRAFGGYAAGDIIIRGCPFGHTFPLWLELAIRIDGSIVFRSWKLGSPSGANGYFHCPVTHFNPPTQAQSDTISGLFSGRIRWEGLQLAIGASVQKLAPIDLHAEEQRLGSKIYLA